MRPEDAGGWLERPNELLDGLKPVEAIERGEIDRVWAIIYDVKSGMPT